MGAQRQIAFQYAAQLWGQQLTSSQIVRVLAFFDPLPCSETAAILGAAGPYWYFANAPAAAGFPGMPPNTWHPAALADKLTGRDIGAALPDNFELFAFFNSNLGSPGCLPGSGWYYGLDNKAPVEQTDLVAVLLHEMGHGLGFTVGPTNASTGVRAGALAFPSVWERHVMDLGAGKTWLQMTDAERAASARNTNFLVWSGPNAAAAAPQVLGPATYFRLPGPNPVRGEHEAQPAQFGPRLTFSPIRRALRPALDGVGVSTDGCEPLPSVGPNGLLGRIALIDRGGCPFTVKVKNAQNAGAVAAVIVNNLPTGLPGMGGVDPAIAIPSIGVSRQVGELLRALPQFGAGVAVELGLSTVLKAWMTGGYPRLYAPDPFAAGSSVSHWDTSLSPNQLMEPFIDTDLTHLLAPPRDLTFPLLRDIGW